MPSHMIPHDIQLTNEYVYSRKFIDQYIDKEIRENPAMELKVIEGVRLLEDWTNQTFSYKSKNDRVAQLLGIDLEQLVRSLFIGVAYCQTPELFTSVTAQLAGRLKFDDKRDSITTVAELMAVLCLTDAFDIVKGERSDSLVIQSLIPISQRLVRYVMQSGYLPPMVCVPDELKNNYDSGYLTHNDCLVLGKKNGHSGDLCLDVLNKQNKIAMRLDTEFLSTVEEEPTFDLDTPEKVQQWSQFKKESYQRYSLIAKQGNKFYLTNKVDMRGRLYVQGYHVSTQASAWKRSSIEFANEELVDGVPDKYKH